MTSMYSKRVLCFSLPNGNQEANENIAHLLLTALRFIVDDLPFLAGSIVPVSKDQPWLHDLRPHGAAYLEVKDHTSKLDFTELRKARFSPLLLDNEQLCPFPDPTYVRDGPVDVCRLRANFVKGGLLLVVSIIHTVCDGRGISDVLKIFADKIRKVQTGELRDHFVGDEDLPRTAFSFDRTSVLSGHGLIGAIDNHPAWTTSPLKLPSGCTGTKTRCALFHINSDLLRNLKQLASSSSSNTYSAIIDSDPLNNQETFSSDKAANMSTHDAIAAFIWRSIMLARQRAGIIPDHTATHFSQAVDCRTRLHLPKPYFGNAIYAVKVSLPLFTLEPANDSFEAFQMRDLQNAACIIRKEVSNVTANKFRDLLAFVERTEMEMLTRPSVLGDLAVGSMLLVSYFWFEMHELDFGDVLGSKIETFRLPSQGLMPGMPVLLPRLPDGSCEFMINEQEEVIKCLHEDKLFLRFAREQC